MNDASHLLNRASSDIGTSSFLNRKDAQILLPRSKNKFMVKIIGKKSFHNIEEKFTNYMPPKDSLNKEEKDIIGKVRSIIKLNDQKIKAMDFPFKNLEDVDFDHSTTGERLKIIFTDLGIKDLEYMLKADYKSPLQNHSENKTSGDLFRIFMKIDKNNDEYIIYVLDPHHLLAYTYYENLYTEEIKQYNLCISKLSSFMY